jgi:5-hydroxyisourate hydrolase
MSPLTTHVLDTASGKPAKGVPVLLERKAAGRWKALGKGKTNADGRITGLLKPGRLTRGVYRLTFDTAAYFKGRRAFYPEVCVVFQVRDERHHHVPLLLNPFGYSTYRGS